LGRRETSVSAARVNICHGGQARQLARSVFACFARRALIGHVFFAQDLLRHGIALGGGKAQPAACSTPRPFSHIAPRLNSAFSSRSTDWPLARPATKSRQANAACWTSVLEPEIVVVFGKWVLMVFNYIHFQMVFPVRTPLRACGAKARDFCRSAFDAKIGA